MKSFGLVVLLLIGVVFGQNCNRKTNGCIQLNFYIDSSCTTLQGSQYFPTNVCYGDAPRYIQLFVNQQETSVQSCSYTTADCSGSPYNCTQLALSSCFVDGSTSNEVIYLPPLSTSTTGDATKIVGSLVCLICCLLILWWHL